MSFRIFGLGIGVILLLLIWTICIVMCLAISRHRGLHHGIVYFIAAFALSFALLRWPRRECDYNEQTTHADKNALTSTTVAAHSFIDNRQTPLDAVDFASIPRMVLAALLLLLTVVFSVRYLKEKLYESHHLKPLPSFGASSSRIR